MDAFAAPWGPMPFTFELGKYPVVVCHWRQPDAYSSASLDAACRAYVTAFQPHRGWYTAVHDFRGTPSISPAFLRAAFDRVLRDPGLAARCLGQALVVSAPAMRAVASTCTAGQLPRFPWRISASLESAMDWAQQRLSPDGVLSCEHTPAPTPRRVAC